LEIHRWLDINEAHLIDLNYDGMDWFKYEWMISRWNLVEGKSLLIQLQSGTWNWQTITEDNGKVLALKKIFWVKNCFRSSSHDISSLPRNP